MLGDTDPGRLERRRRPASEQFRPAGARRSLRPAHRHAGRPAISFITKGVAATYTQGLSDALDLKIVGAYREGEGRQFIDFEELNANLFQVPARVQRRPDQRRSAAHLHGRPRQGRGRRVLLRRHGARRVRRLARRAQPHVADQGQRRHREHRGLLRRDLEPDRPAEPQRRRALERGRQGSDGVRRSSTSGGWPPNADAVRPEQRAGRASSLLGPPQTNYTNDRSFSDVSPRFGFDYKLDATTCSAYVSYSQGFKSGGFDMRGNATRQSGDARRLRFRDRPTTTRSASSRRWLDDTLQLNLTVFYTPYRGRADHDAAVPDRQRRADQRHRGAERRQAAQPGRRAGIGVAAGRGADAGAERRLPRSGVRGVPGRLHAAAAELHASM